MAPATTLKRSVTRTLDNSLLDEDQPPLTDSDEIRATVTLTPEMPVAVGPIDSNLQTITL